MPNSPVVRLKIDAKSIKIDTTFVAHSSNGQAVAYLNQSEVDPRTSLSLAIATLYAPLGVAMNGGNRQEVLDKIQECQQVANSYWNNALMSVSGEEAMNSNASASVMAFASSPERDNSQLDDERF